MMGRFMQYYRENARYLERTYDFVERMGIEQLRQILVQDSGGHLRPVGPGHAGHRGRVPGPVVGGRQPGASQPVCHHAGGIRRAGTRVEVASWY